MKIETNNLLNFNFLYTLLIFLLIGVASNYVIGKIASFLGLSFIFALMLRMLIEKPLVKIKY